MILGEYGHPLDEDLEAFINRHEGEIKEIEIRLTARLVGYYMKRIEELSRSEVSAGWMDRRKNIL